MKKVQWKAFMKKFIAGALAAAMIISTPSTAFAADFAENFATVDDADTDDADGENLDHTAVIEPDEPNATDTTTINEKLGQVESLIISGSNKISLKKGKKTTLSATLFFTDGKVDNATIAIMNKQIQWTSSNPDVVAVDRDENNPNKCILHAYGAGTTTITAKLYKVKYDENGNRKEEITESTPCYEDSVTVTVREPQKDHFAWDIPKETKFYVKGTYCLSDYLKMNGSSLASLIEDEVLESASDVVTYAVNCSSKVATLSGDMLTVKGEGDITLCTILPDGTEGPSATITTDAGSPVKKMVASESNKVELDFGEKDEPNYTPTADVSVEGETNDGEDIANTTDDIIWTSSNKSVARVEVIDNPKNPRDKTKAKITAKGVGKATITARSTSGKTVKFSVTVKATLIRIEIPAQGSSEYAWSGKTEELVINRVPDKNKDKLKVTSGDKRVKVKSTAGSVMITPAADLKLTNDEDKKSVGEGDDKIEWIEVGITVENSDASAETTIKVRQSDVQIKKVIDVSTIEEESSVEEESGVETESGGEDKVSTDKKAPDMNKQTIKANPDDMFEYMAVLDDKHKTPADGAVSWVSSNEKVATISDGVLEVVGPGTAKITVSSVYYEKAKKKYSQSKKTFTVKSAPICDKIEFKSTVAAYDLSKKKAVTINIKQQLAEKADNEKVAKKASDTIDWYVNGVKQKQDKKYVTDKKITLQPAAFKNLKEGAEITVMAVSQKNSAAREVATVYVVKSAKKVEFAKKSVSLGIGKTTQVSTKVTGSKSDIVVSYTVDKKGASVVSVEKDTTEDGKEAVKLTAIGEGKATVTALTASGKKAALKVEVKSSTSSKKEPSSESED